MGPPDRCPKVGCGILRSSGHLGSLRRWITSVTDVDQRQSRGEMTPVDVTAAMHGGQPCSATRQRDRIRPLMRLSVRT